MTMSTAKEITDQLIDRAKTAKKFDLKLRVQENWMPCGVAPFDIHIKDGIARVSVIAQNLQEAQFQVSLFMESDDWITDK